MYCERQISERVRNEVTIGKPEENIIAWLKALVQEFGKVSCPTSFSASSWLNLPS